MKNNLKTRFRNTVFKNRLFQKCHNFNFVKVMENNMISKFLEPKRGETICDIACGSGLYSLSMARKGCQVYGVDLSDTNIEVAKMTAKGYGCQFQIANAENLPFETGTFDKVVSVCALEHFDHDEKALAEMNRVLKPNGTLVLTVDSFNYAGIKKHIQEKHKRDHEVVNYYSDSQIREKIQRHGFTVSNIEYFVSSPIAAFLYVFGIKSEFGLWFKLLFPIAYPLGIVSEKFCSRHNQGFRLAIKSIKAS